METICICGAGTMGRGIAQLAAQSGYRTLLHDIDATRLAGAKLQIDERLGAMAARSKMDASQKKETQQRLRYSDAPGDCRADLIIEAIAEDLALKRKLFHDLALINPPRTILATNTSSLSVESIASTVDHPERVIGMHFFNPPATMKLVEVVTTTVTSAQTLDQVVSLARQWGKQPAVCRDSPGFIVNRVARPYYLEALRILESGDCSLSAIDEIMEASGFRMGPFRLMDMIGNDINFAVSHSIYEALGRPPRLKPSSIQQQKVSAGEWGRKTGKGFYSYPDKA